MMDRCKKIRRYNTAKIFRLSKFRQKTHGKSICPASFDDTRKLSAQETENIKHALVDFVLRVSTENDKGRYTSEIEILPAVLDTLLDNFT